MEINIGIMARNTTHTFENKRVIEIVGTNNIKIYENIMYVRYTFPTIIITLHFIPA